MKISLAAFGKHPGWDDHIPELGDMTDLLVDVRRDLYIEGIGRSIDSGAWDRLESTQRLENFHHLFVWRMGREIVAGRIWSSSDGKGRKRYPMVVCAQCVEIPLPWIVREVFSCFAEIEQQCHSTTLASDVSEIIDAAQAQLRTMSENLEPANIAQCGFVDPIAYLTDRKEMGQRQEGFMRVLYQIEREVVGQHLSRAAISAKHIRVPVCAGSPSETILLWTAFLADRLRGQSVPVLFVLPIGRSWVDLIFGNQVGPKIYGIRVLPNTLPFTTDIPYKLDSSFVQYARKIIDESCRKESTDEGAQKIAAERSAAGGVKKKITLVFMLILVAVFVGWTLFYQLGLIGPPRVPDMTSWIQWWVDRFSMCRLPT